MNPNFGVSVMEDYLLAQQLKAIQNPSKQNTFKTKHLNVWCNAKAAAFNMTNWEKCAEPGLSRGRFAGNPCFMGLDLASKGDLNAVVYLFPEDGGTYALFADFFLPEDALESTQNADIYRGWASEGWITLTPGGMVDYDAIEEHILEQAKRFEVRECPYDPYQAAQLVTHLADSGLTMVEFGATVKNFSDPFKTLIALVDAGKIRHDGNPVLTWCMSNTVCFTDAKDNIYPRKDRYEYKIDGAVAAIMALGRAQAVPEEGSGAVIITQGFADLWGTCNGGMRRNPYRTPHRAASECQRIGGASFSDFSNCSAWARRWLPGRCETPESAMRFSAVFACVRLLGGAVASAPVKVYLREGTEQRQLAHGQGGRAAPAAQPPMTSTTFWKTFVAHKGCFRGTATPTSSGSVPANPWGCIP